MKKKHEIRLSKGAVRDLKKIEPALRDFLYNRIHELLKTHTRMTSYPALIRNSVLSIISLEVWNTGLSII